MPRIIVTTDPSEPRRSPATLMDERVQSVHLSGDHAAAQLIERLAWAISDAEDQESSPATSTPRLQQPSRARRGRSRVVARATVSA